MLLKSEKTMAKTLTIELSETLEENLDILANTADRSLEQLILQTLQHLANAVQSLQDASPALRMQAARTLGLMGTETVIPALVQALGDDDMMFCQAAAEALQQIGTEAVQRVLACELNPVHFENSSFSQGQNSRDQNGRGLPAVSESSTPASTFDPLASLISTLHLGTTDLGEKCDRDLTKDL